MAVMFCTKLAWLRDQPDGDPLDNRAIVAVNAQLDDVVDQGNGWLKVQTTTIDGQRREGFIPADCASADNPANHPGPTGPTGPTGPQINFNSPRIARGRSDMARLIATAFAQSRFGFPQQVAAIANAIRESNLNPGAVGDSGVSIGLFQLNTRAGMGVGHEIDKLKDPNENISIVIAAARAVPKFVNASNVADAVDAFVRSIEIPAHMQDEIVARTAIAKDLITPSAPAGGPPSSDAVTFIPDVVFGDSIGEGVRHNAGQNFRGITKVGKGPQWVLDNIGIFLQIDSLVGKNVVLSSGLSNDVRDASLPVVESQIDLLLENKANVDLLGVGTNFDEFNPRLRDLAAHKNIRFTMLTANDGVHPHSYVDLLKAIESTNAANA